jgi:hypothetical protein
LSGWLSLKILTQFSINFTKSCSDFIDSTIQMLLFKYINLNQILDSAFSLMSLLKNVEGVTGFLLGLCM